MSDDAHSGHEFTPREYVNIASVLFVLTAMEFSTYFIDFAWGHVPLLLGLMAIKFLLVAGFFMHLKFDLALYKQLVIAGLAFAGVLYLIVFVALAEIPVGTGL